MVNLEGALDEQVQSGQRIARRRVTRTHALDLGAVPANILKESVASGRRIASKKATGHGSFSLETQFFNKVYDLKAVPNAGVLYEVDCPAGCGATLKDQRQKIAHLRSAHPWYLAGKAWRRG